MTCLKCGVGVGLLFIALYLLPTPTLAGTTVDLTPHIWYDTGWVACEMGAWCGRDHGLIQTGRRCPNGCGWDLVRGFSRFDTTGIPDEADIVDVGLIVWVSNPDQPGDLAETMPFEIREVKGDPPGMFMEDLQDAIEHGTLYVDTVVEPTGPAFCASSFERREYSLTAAAPDVKALLIRDRFSLGLNSPFEIADSVDRLRFIGVDEVLDGDCGLEDMAGKRPVLRVTHNRPPVCALGTPAVAECLRTTAVAVDGSPSSDPDLDVLGFTWSTDCPGGRFSDPGAASPLLLLEPQGACEVRCEVRLEVSDGIASDSCVAAVHVVDTTAPVVAANPADDRCLWPPSHRPVCLGTGDLDPLIDDGCGTPVDWWFTACASSQADDAGGDGRTTGDCEVLAGGAGICPRSERQGGDREGRRYEFTIAATDACGNAAAPVHGATLTVTHDLRDASGCRGPR